MCNFFEVFPYTYILRTTLFTKSAFYTVGSFAVIFGDIFIIIFSVPESRFLKTFEFIVNSEIIGNSDFLRTAVYTVSA